MRFFNTIATNMIKFPFFEIVNIIMSGVKVSPALRGTVTGIIFTTVTLPITNYRFLKSMNKPVDNVAALYQAYLPTVLRDVVYGITRNKVMTSIMTGNKSAMATAYGRFTTMFVVALSACVISAPGNELRGFVLQPPASKKPFSEFFDPVKTARSTTIGGLIMATSLGCGAALTPFIEAFAERFKDPVRQDPLSAFLVFLVLLTRFQQNRKLSAIQAAMKTQK